MPERSQLYRPFPTAQPTDKPTPYIHEEFSPVHFDQSIGDALKHLGHAGYGVLGESTRQVGAAMANLGKSFEHAGDEIFNRASAIKHVENQTAAVDADTKFRIEGNKMTEAYEAQSGDAASGALDAHMKKLEEVRQTTRGTLQNDEVRNMFDQRSLPALGSMVMRAGKHAKDQGRAAAIAARDANFKIRLNDLMIEAAQPEFDMSSLEKKRNALIDEFNEQLKLEGIDMKGPTGQVRLIEQMSKINKAVIAGVGKRDPKAALDLLEKWTKPGMNMFKAEDAINMKTELKQKYAEVAARTEADKLMVDIDKPKTMEERDKEPGIDDLIKKGDDIVKADPIMKDDPYAPEIMRNKIINVWSKVQLARNKHDEMLNRDINNSVMGIKNPTLPKPMTEEELEAQNPGIMDKIRAQGASEYMRVQRALRNNIRENDYAPLPWREQQYEILLGKFGNKDTLKEALQVDATQLEWPAQWRRHIIELQNKYYGKQGDPSDDPRIGHMLNVIDKAMGLPTGVNKTENPNRYHQYTGTIMRMGMEYMKLAEKGKLSDEEIILIGRAARQKIDGDSRFLGMGERLMYEVPNKFRAEMQAADPKIKEDEIVEEWARQYIRVIAPDIYQRTHGGKALPAKKAAP